MQGVPKNDPTFFCQILSLNLTKFDNFWHTDSQNDWKM